MGKLTLIALVCILALLPMAGAMAQEADEEVGRGSFRYPAMSPTTSDTDAPEVSASNGWGWTMPDVIVDTDTGVDDAAALAWLFRKAGDNPSKILGIATVSGNTTVANATENVLLMLSQTPWVWNPASLPGVYEGADAPLGQSLSSTGKLLHGTDGFGYVRYAAEALGWNPELLSWLVQDGTTDFYCGNAINSTESNPVTIVALGPLTNIAEALDASDPITCPMENYRYVILGGAKESGNQTPTSEFNFWQDPEAAKMVFDSELQLDITVIPRERFDRFTLNLRQVDSLLRAWPPNPNDQWGPVADLVGSALCWYVGAQSTDYITGETVDNIRVSTPDPSAMMYALNPRRYGAASDPALARVMESPELVRGQSVIGYYYPYPEALTMEMSDAEISGIIDGILPGDVTDPYKAAGRVAAIYNVLAEAQMGIPPNAWIPSRLYARRMRTDYLSALSVRGRTQRKCFPDPEVGGASTLSTLRIGSLLITEFDFEDTTDTTLHLPILSR